MREKLDSDRTRQSLVRDFRFYVPLDPHFDQNWPLPDIEKIKRRVPRDKKNSPPRDIRQPTLHR